MSHVALLNSNRLTLAAKKMQTAESVCLWNYQFKNNYNKTSPPNSNNSLATNKNLSIDCLPYLACTERYACQDEMSSRATFFCIQCNSLQCQSCEEEIHQNSSDHERLNLNQIDEELCSNDRRHRAIFFCSTCAMFFCYHCYENQHQHADGRQHKPQKSRQGTEPINIVPQAEVMEEILPPIETSPHSFEDFDQPEKLINQSAPQRLQCNEQMLLESMFDDQNDTIHPIPINEQVSPSNRGFLLIDANEEFTIDSADEFLQLLKSPEDIDVKCVSILGNTGDGKSFTLNQVFFDGDEVFQTSSSAESCTIGVWSALDGFHRTLVLDTEGRLGLSTNDNRRNRLLLKTLCVSDVIIYRTRASKLPNDMFQFLSDASNAFEKYFQHQLENLFQTNRVNGPTLVIFHETQHTGILKDHFQCHKTAVEQIKDRFKAMKLSCSAYSAIEYVGIQTLGRKKSDFSEIKATISAALENNQFHSPRRLSTVFHALKSLNETFNHTVSPSIPSVLPDDFFACGAQCLCCGMKCKLSANHSMEERGHDCARPCLYNKEFDNEVWKCLQCYQQDRDTIVYGKLITKNDGLVQGLLKYVWSGCVIECSFHGEIYRSRKHWYGNTEPKDVTRMEMIHIWPDDHQSRLASDVTPRKFMEMIVYASSYLSAPTKMLTELVADQVAPSYWIPNKDVLACSSCQLHFGSEYSKHHCRACGHVFCDTCTTNRRIVPWIDTEKTVRVCNQCFGHPKSRPPPAVVTATISSSSSNSCSSSIDIQKQSNVKTSEHGSSGDSTSTMSSGEHLNDLCLSPTDIFDIEQPGAGPVLVDIPTSRRVYETVKNGLERIGVNYPLELIKESTRPSYWRPDHECPACFICKRPFNSTTNRLHHCRSCGDGVCENCSPNQRPVPSRDWLTAVRVCKLCDEAMNIN